MDIRFIDTNPDEVKSLFPEFYANRKVYFEIMVDNKPIGFYGVKDIGSEIGEISIYINEDCRKEITKSLATRCLTFPSELGFKKALIYTHLRSLERFLKKMGKLGVNYLFQNEDLHWFEVNYGS